MVCTPYNTFFRHLNTPKQVALGACHFSVLFPYSLQTIKIKAFFHFELKSNNHLKLINISRTEKYFPVLRPFSVHWKDKRACGGG